MHVTSVSSGSSGEWRVCLLLSFKVKDSRGVGGTSLVAQWLRTCLPSQRCGFSPWSGNEDPHAEVQLTPHAATRKSPPAAMKTQCSQNNFKQIQESIVGTSQRQTQFWSTGAVPMCKWCKGGNWVATGVSYFQCQRQVEVKPGVSGRCEGKKHKEISHCGSLWWGSRSGC